MTIENRNTSGPLVQPRDFDEFIYMLKGTSQETGGIWIGHVPGRKRLALVCGGPGWSWGVAYFTSERMANQFLDYWEGRVPLVPLPAERPEGQGPR